MAKSASPKVPQPAIPPSPAKPIPRYLRRQNKSRIAGLACLEQRGLEHYQRMGELSAAARKAKPPASRSTKEETHYVIERDQTAVVRAVAAGTGRSQSQVVREALAFYFTSFGLGAEALATAGAKAPKSKRPKPKKP